MDITEIAERLGTTKKHVFVCESCETPHVMTTDSFKSGQWLCGLCDEVEEDEVFTGYTPDFPLTGHYRASFSIRAI